MKSAGLLSAALQLEKYDIREKIWVTKGGDREKSEKNAPGELTKLN